MLQHILNQNPIPPTRILHKHMCHRSCQLPILYDRRTAHTLHNPPRQFQKPRVRHLDYHALILVAGILIHLLYLYLIILQFPAYITPDICNPRLHVLAAGNLHGLAGQLLLKLLVHGSEYALVGVL